MRLIKIPIAAFAHAFSSVRIGWGTEPRVAYADGVVDDTAVIQAVIDSLEEGDAVVFPPGTYRVTETVSAATSAVSDGDADFDPRAKSRF